MFKDELIKEDGNTLLERMIEGLAYCQMVGKNDFIYRFVNPSFQRLTGLKDVIGKKVSEIVPGIQDTDPLLIAAYAKVAETGNPDKFEYFVNALNMWFTISVYSPKHGFFVALFDVITERRNLSEALEKTREAKELLKKTVDQFELMNNTIEKFELAVKLRKERDLCNTQQQE